MALCPFIEEAHFRLHEKYTVHYLLQHGKPKTVYVRDEYMQDRLTDLCERISVPIKVKPKLKAIDTFEKEFMKRKF